MRYVTLAYDRQKTKVLQELRAGVSLQAIVNKFAHGASINSLWYWMWNIDKDAEVAYKAGHRYQKRFSTQQHIAYLNRNTIKSKLIDVTTSLNSIARQIGISPLSLRYFVAHDSELREIYDKRASNKKVWKKLIVQQALTENSYNMTKTAAVLNCTKQYISQLVTLFNLRDFINTGKKSQKEIKNRMRKAALVVTLQACHFDKKLAAMRLGISTQSFYKQLEIKKVRFPSANRLLKEVKDNLEREFNVKTSISELSEILIGKLNLSAESILQELLKYRKNKIMLGRKK